MRMVYTPGPGRIDLDEDWGSATGPRAIDGTAGKVRFADPASDRPLTDFRAVAVLYSERPVRVPGPGHISVVEPRMVHSVVLVPHGIAAGSGAFLDALAAGAAPQGFSILGAAEELAESSLLVGMAQASVCRDVAKATARVAGLPVVELYGEFPVWRPRDRLDLTLRDRLPGAPQPVGPGQPPPGIVASLDDGELLIREVAAAGGARLRRILSFAGAGLSTVAAVSLYFIALPLAIVFAIVAVFALFLGLTGRKPGGRTLAVGNATVRWEGGEGSDVIATEAIEMLRVVDSTLVVVGRDDEVRCTFADQAGAHWARAAMHHHLLPPPGASA